MMRRVLMKWLFAAMPITIVCLGMYAVGQNINRQNANDTQIQMAEDAAVRIYGGDDLSNVVPHPDVPVDIARSLSPWLTIYDAEAVPLESSAVLEHEPPKLPQGVFDTTNKSAQADGPVWINGEYRVTWQPQPGVRQAVVVVQTKDKKYFVAAGRSLRLSEERTAMLGFNMFFGWLGALILTLIWSFVVIKLTYVFGRGSAQGN